MKNIIYLFLSAILMASCSSQPVELGVMTFNLRYDNPGDSLNSWAYRKDVAAETVRESGVDLLGCQEVLAHQLKDMENSLSGFKAIGVGRTDGKQGGEYCPVLYNANRFDALDSGWFWLSETPEVAGSKGWDGACERITTWVILRDKGSKKQLLFMNTHLDHIGQVARQEGVTLLLNRARELANGLPVVITGDFNSNPESEVVKHVLGSGEYRDSRLASPSVAGIAGTYNAFGQIPPADREYIDYIFITRQFTVSSYEVLPEKLHDIYVSDHAAVLAKLQLR